MSIQDDLITIIDLCYEAVLAGGGTRVMRELHDMAHVLEGGDRTRPNWLNVETLLGFDDHLTNASPAWPDVKRRGIELLERLERGTTGGEG